MDPVDSDQRGEGEAEGMQMQLPAWTQFVNVVLGGWLLSSVFAFDYASDGLWFSDLISGALIVVLSLIAVSPQRGWARWATTVVGLWLLFAPLVFWVPSPAVYLNDTLVGALVVAFAILVGGMPGMRMLPGADTPPGWTYNPSTWVQRAPMIGLALVGFFLARHLAGFQLGHLDSTWEPFFGEQTEQVLTSDVSRMFPISDAGLGAAAYLIEALSGFMGGRDRWRTMPWMVLMFGVLVMPLGIVSIVLVILQPVAVGAWCTVCLLTAVVMLAMIPFAADEVVAMAQFLRAARREGQSVWTVFWRGGTLKTARVEMVDEPEWNRPLGELASEMRRGVTAPWNLLASVMVGGWLMASPGVLGGVGGSADVNHLVGPLVITIAVVAMAEVIRSARFLNLAAAAVALVAPLLLGSTIELAVSNLLVALVLVTLSLPRGPILHRYAGWQRLTR